MGRQTNLKGSRIKKKKKAIGDTDGGSSGWEWKAGERRKDKGVL